MTAIIPLIIKCSPRLSYSATNEWIQGFSEFTKTRMGKVVSPTRQFYQEIGNWEQHCKKKRLGEPMWEVTLTEKKTPTRIEHKTVGNVKILASLPKSTQKSAAKLLGYHTLAHYYDPSCSSKYCLHKALDDEEHLDILATKFNLTGSLPLCDVHENWTATPRF